MLMNNLDPEVAENPDALVVYGGHRPGGPELGGVRRDRPRAARAGRRRDAARPERQAGRRVPDPPLGAPGAHRQLEPGRRAGRPGSTSASSRRPGLMMYGQMTAGSWIYIGTQGILQGTYETFAELARQHFGGSLRGTVTLTAGLGGMGGAQPLAVTMNDGVAHLHRGRRGARPPSPRDRLRRPADRRSRRGAGLGPGRRRRRAAAVDRARRQRRRDRAGLGQGRRAVRRRHRPDERPRRARRVRPGRDRPGRRHRRSGRPSRPSTSTGRCTRWPTRSGRCSSSSGPGRSSSTTATTCGRRPSRPGVEDAFSYPGLRAGLHPAALLRGQRAVPVGRPERRPGGHLPDRSGARRAVPGQAGAPSLAGDGPRQGPVPGPAGPDLLARLRRAGEGRSRVQPARRQRARSRRRSSSAATTSTRARSPHPNRETEAMRDGSDAVADWPLLNALVNTAAGASWVSIHHGGGVGIGYSQHAGMVVVADGTDARGGEARAGPDDRPRDGRHPPRRRRLRAGDRGRPGARRPRPDARRAGLSRASPSSRRRARSADRRGRSRAGSSVERGAGLVIRRPRRRCRLGAAARASGSARAADRREQDRHEGEAAEDAADDDRAPGADRGPTRGCRR